MGYPSSILGITLLTALPKLFLNDWVLTWVPIVVMHRQGTFCRLAFGDHWADDLSELSWPVILHSVNTCLTNEPAEAGSWGSFRDYPRFIAFLNMHCTLSHPEAPPATDFISQAVAAFEDWQRSNHTIETWSYLSLVIAGSQSREADRTREKGSWGNVSDSKPCWLPLKGCLFWLGWEAMTSGRGQCLVKWRF